MRRRLIDRHRLSIHDRAAPAPSCDSVRPGEGLLAGIGVALALQQVESLGELLEQLLGAEERSAGRGERAALSADFWRVSRRLGCSDLLGEHLEK